MITTRTDRQIDRLFSCLTVQKVFTINEMGFPFIGIECQTVVDKAYSKREESQMKSKRIGVDIAKNVFQLHGVDADEKTVLIKKLSRIKFIAYSDLSERSFWSM